MTLLLAPVGRARRFAPVPVGRRGRAVVCRVAGRAPADRHDHPLAGGPVTGMVVVDRGGP